jgi:ATP-binding cassette subfamily F protein 1
VNKAFEKYEKQLKAAKSSGKNTKANQEKILAAAQRQQAKRGGKGKNEPIDDAGTAAVDTHSTPPPAIFSHLPEPSSEAGACACYSYFLLTL